MAQRKKRPAVRKAKSVAPRKARKPSKSARKRPVKRTVAKATPRKRIAKAKRNRGAKSRKRVRAGQPSIPAIETVVVDMIEEPIPGVTVVSEFEATEVRKAGAGREQPEEGHLAPPESEEP
jgi:hypothetical protein